MRRTTIRSIRLAFTPSDLTGGTPTSCRVVINGVAGPGGRVLAIFDNSAYATTPSNVTVPPGATEVTFPIPTSAVSSIRVVTVTARVSAGEKTGDVPDQSVTSVRMLNGECLLS